MSNSTAQTLFNQIGEYFQNQDLKSAQEVLGQLRLEVENTNLGWLELVKAYAGLGNFSEAAEILKVQNIEVSFTDIELSYIYFKTDQEYFDRWFFRHLQATKELLFQVDHRLGEHATKSDREIDNLERFYFDELDRINEVDMKIRLDRVVYFKKD